MRENNDDINDIQDIIQKKIKFYEALFVGPDPSLPHLITQEVHKQQAFGAVMALKGLWQAIYDEYDAVGWRRRTPEENFK